MEGERIVFSEETAPGGHVRLIACGPLDESMFEALEDFIRHQRARLQTSTSPVDESVENARG